jgi:molecular chaperone IbpA
MLHVKQFIPESFGTQFKDVEKFFVGFDEQFTRLAQLHNDVTKNIPNYPPYNIKKTGEYTYVIEMAVAGFAKHDIEIEFADDKLIVKGSTKEEADNDYLFKGIANRAFTRTFALNDQIEITDAGLFNGMLQIALERIIPEHKKPKKIDVRDADDTVLKTSKANRQMLTESSSK